MQGIAEFRVGAFVDDFDSAFVGIFPAKIGYALFSNDHLHAVLAVVEVTAEGNDWADVAALGETWTGKDGNIGVAREISAPADSVHHAVAHDVCAVHVAEQVDFDRCVDGNNAETAHNLGIVRDFLWAQDHPPPEEVQVVIDVAELVIADGQ